MSYEVGYLNEELFNKFLAQAEEVGRIIGVLRVSVERQRHNEVNKNYSALNAQGSALNG